MSNINVVTAMPELGGHRVPSTNALTVDWKFERTLGPFTKPLKTTGDNFLGASDLTDYLGSEAIWKEWHTKDFIALKLRGYFSNNTSTNGYLALGGSDNPKTFSISKNTTSNVYLEKICIDMIALVANNANFYAPIAYDGIGNKGFAAHYPVTSFYYINVALTNLYIDVYTGTINLNK